jgi:tRNA pseudouridine38-40 synthase
VAHCLTGKPVPPSTVAAALNALLPPDVRIRAAAAAAPDFHARFSAVARTYRYRIARTRTLDPFRYRYVYAVWRELDSEAVDRASRSLVGVHDFSSFARHLDPDEPATREVYEASWSREPGEWTFMIRANGFLRTMVRTIVGTLLEIGAGRRPAEDIERLLLVRDRGAAGVTAPASGLELAEVAYPLPSDGSQDEQLFSIKW